MACMSLCRMVSSSSLACASSRPSTARLRWSAKFSCLALSCFFTLASSAFQALSWASSTAFSSSSPSGASPLSASSPSSPLLGAVALIWLSSSAFFASSSASSLTKSPSRKRTSLCSSGLCLLALSSSALTMPVRQASITPRLPRAIRPRKSCLLWYQKPATMPRTWKGSSRPMRSRLWLKLSSSSLRSLTSAALSSSLPASAVMRGLCSCHQLSKASRIAASLACRPGLPSMAGLRSVRLVSSGLKSR
ncbi:hypothetical protein D3C78_825700 [compost metagenome]